MNRNKAIDRINNEVRKLNSDPAFQEWSGERFVQRSFHRLVVCNTPGMVEGLVKLAKAELQEPPSATSVEEYCDEIAEGQRLWFDTHFGGLSRAAGTTVAALRVVGASQDPLDWVANRIDESFNVALYCIYPEQIWCALVKRYEQSDEARFGDSLQYRMERSGAALKVTEHPDHRGGALYQLLVRQFGFFSEQLGWIPDFFYSAAGAATDPAIADEHVWVLRGRGEGDGFPQYFKIMTRRLPQRWFERIYGDGEQMSYKDDVVVHQIMSWGLAADELEALQQAELESAIYRIEEDPACQPLYRSILEKAVREGLLEEFDEEQQARNAATRLSDGRDVADDYDYFAALAQQIEERFGSEGNRK